MDSESGQSEVDQLMDRLLEAEDADQYFSLLARHTNRIGGLPEFPSRLRDRAERISRSDPDGARRLRELAENLSTMEKVDVRELPPYGLYEQLAAGELSSSEVVEGWRRGLESAGWDSGWLMALNSIIQVRAQQSPMPKGLSEWASVQVEVARLVDDLGVLAQLQNTASGCLLSEGKVYQGMRYAIDAMTTALSCSPAVMSVVAWSAIQNVRNHIPLLKADSTRPLDEVCTDAIRAAIDVLHLLDTSTSSDMFNYCVEVVYAAYTDPPREPPPDVIAPFLTSRLPDTSATVAGLAVLADMLSEDRVLERLKLLESAHHVAQQLGQPRDLAIASFNLAAILLTAKSRDDVTELGVLGRFRIDELFLSASAFFAQTGERLRQALALGGAAEAVLAESGPSARPLNMACDWLVQALSLLDVDHDEPEEILKMYGMLGQARRDSGDIDESEAAFGTAADLADRLELWDWSSRSRYWLALTILMDDRIDMPARTERMLPILREGLQLPCSTEEVIPLLELLVNRLLFRQTTIRGQRELDSTWELVDLIATLPASLDIESMADPEQKARVKSVFGWAYFRIGKSRKLATDPEQLMTTAAQYLWDAAELFDRAGNAEKAAVAWLHYLQIAEQASGLTISKAEAALAAAAESIKASDRPNAVILVGEMAQHAERLGDSEQALALYGDAARMARDLPAFRKLGTGKLFLANRANILVRQGRWEEAHNDLREALEIESEALEGWLPPTRSDAVTEFESSWAIESAFFQQVPATMAVVCSRLGRPEEAYYYSERARASVLHQLIAKRFPDDMPDATSPTEGVHRLRDLLGPETCFLQYSLSEPESLVFLHSAEGLRVYPLPGIGREEMRLLSANRTSHDADGDLATAFQTYAADPNRQDLLDNCCTVLDGLGERMFDILLAPLWSQLDRPENKRLVISSNLGLERLPWNAIRLPAGDPYLPQRFILTHVPSGAILSHLADQPRAGLRSTAIVTGDNPDLQGPDVEAKAIQAVLRSASMEAEWTSCHRYADLLAAVKNRSHLHLACHGRFEPEEPLQTRLILDAATGTGAVLDDLLRFKDAPPASGFGVVLSACDVGLVTPDRGAQQLGIPVAFLLAGASYIISSSWPVRDWPTALLMHELYSRLVSDKDVDPARALQQAQSWIHHATGRELADRLDAISHSKTSALPVRLQISKLTESFAGREDDRPWAHPYWWGGFHYMGVLRGK